MLGTWLHKKTYWFRCIQCIMAKTDNDKSKHLQFSGTDNCEVSIVILATKQLQICNRYLGQVYIHHFLLLLRCSQEKIWTVRFKTWPFHSVTLPNTPGRLFCSPSICVYVFIGQGQYVHTGIDNVHWWWQQRWSSKRLLAINPPNAAASPRIFYWIQSPWNF